MYSLAQSSLHIVSESVILDLLGNLVTNFGGKSMMLNNVCMRICRVASWLFKIWIKIGFKQFPSPTLRSFRSRCVIVKWMENDPWFRKCATCICVDESIFVLHLGLEL